MALGGGTFLSQNKVLPGSYINFVSAAKAGSKLGTRGVAALPLTLSWGIDGEIFTVTAEEFQKDSLKLFGYEYTNPALKGLRDLFLHINKGHFYKVNSGGVRAACDFCKAKYAGTRGNAIKLVITANEASTAENSVYDVETLFDGVIVDEQKGIKNMGDLKVSPYVDWSTSATLELTAGMNLTGGTDGTAAEANYQVFLDKIEAYSFNTLGLVSTSETLKALFANFTKRLRDEVGVKFQCVLYGYGADHEGIISVENKLQGEIGDNADSAALVYWLTGAEAGCGVNQSLTNVVYDGEYAIDTNYTQKQLEEAIEGGKLLLHKVGDKVRVLEDINTFVSFTADKSSDFANNQTVRVLDQIASDIATVFNSKYLGAVPNDEAGRMSLWNDIVTHHKELARIRAIENFKAEDVIVAAGNNKKSVVVTDLVTPVNAMTQLYMTVIVE